MIRDRVRWMVALEPKGAGRRRHIKRDGRPRAPKFKLPASIAADRAEMGNARALCSSSASYDETESPVAARLRSLLASRFAVSAAATSSRVFTASGILPNRLM